MPRTVFVSPATPFGNRAWLRRLIGEAKDELLWLDKHFMPAAFDELWSALDANVTSQVRILSLSLPGTNDTRKGKRDYRDLRQELLEKGIDLEWRVIDSALIKDTHDRWIITAGEAWNVPNVNAIFSGQHSELMRSEKLKELRDIFMTYWEQATQVS